MLSAAEITVDHLSRAVPSLTLASSRPAQAYMRVVEPADLFFPTLTVALDPSPAGTRVARSDVLPNTALSDADKAIAKILRLEKLEADWDGNDASKPIAYSSKEARSFIRSLGPDSIIPRPALHADGHMILFVREPHVYAELEFLGDSKIGIYARWGDRKWSDEIFFDGRSLPDALSQIGFSLS